MYPIGRPIWAGVIFVDKFLSAMKDQSVCMIRLLHKSNSATTRRTRARPKNKIEPTLCPIIYFRAEREDDHVVVVKRDVKMTNPSR
jgi:hypothetical protein